MRRAVFAAGAVGFVAGYLGNFVIEAWLSRTLASAYRYPVPDPGYSQDYLAERMGLYGLMAGQGR